jgi:hypothetical protein
MKTRSPLLMTLSAFSAVISFFSYGERQSRMDTIGSGRERSWVETFFIQVPSNWCAPLQRPGAAPAV